VLVSQATQSLVEDDEEHLAVRLEDLGEHRLKDIDRPVRLYQLAATGLPTDFPRRDERSSPQTSRFRAQLQVAGASRSERSQRRVYSQWQRSWRPWS
jgi:hypothetical protein